MMKKAKFKIYDYCYNSRDFVNNASAQTKKRPVKEALQHAVFTGLNFTKIIWVE